MSNEQLRRMTNNISIYILAKGYDNAIDEYQLKSPIYSKCNINMAKSGEHLFHRFLPDIDLSLVGEDFEYFRGLKAKKNVQSKLTIRLVVDNYLGSSRSADFYGIVSRQNTQWDFDAKRLF